MHPIDSYFPVSESFHFVKKKMLVTVISTSISVGHTDDGVEEGGEPQAT